MEEQLVSLEVAKLLKEKGFNVVVRTAYHTETEKDFIGACSYNWNSMEDSVGVISAPTQSLAQKWLRETKKVIFLVDYLVKDEVYLFSILVNNVWYNLHYRAIYEEALEEALKEALKLI